MVAAERGIIVRHRVSLAGRVTLKGGANATGGVVTLDAVPQVGGREGPRRPGARRRETQIRRDGLYYFLDLPAGRYALGGQDERGHVIEAELVTISATEGSAKATPLSQDLVASTNPAPSARRSSAKAGIGSAKRQHGKTMD